MCIRKHDERDSLPDQQKKSRVWQPFATRGSVSLAHSHCEKRERDPLVEYSHVLYQSHVAHHPARPLQRFRLRHHAWQPILCWGLQALQFLRLVHLKSGFSPNKTRRNGVWNSISLEQSKVTYILPTIYRFVCAHPHSKHADNPVPPTCRASYLDHRSAAN